MANEKTNQTTKTENRKNIISYHTFIFPFTWGIGDIKREKFFKKINSMDNFEFETKKEAELLGNYFTKSARRAIYTEKEFDSDEPVWNCKLKSNKLNDAKFIINGNYKEKNGEEWETIEKEFVLNLTAIRFKIFNTGVATLIYETNNTKYSDYDDILRINNWGSRLFTQFVGVDIDEENLTTDKKKYEFPYVSEIVVDNETANSETTSNKSIEIDKHVSYLFSEKITINIDKASKYGKVYINPILDEKMFVCCLLKDDNLIDEIKCYNNGEYNYVSSAINEGALLNRNSIASKLDKLIFVDVNPTCKSKKVLKETMQNHIYERWIENGNVYGVSSKALVSIVNKNVEDFPISSFLRYYTEIAILVLMQRTTLMFLEEDLGAVISKKSKHKLEDIQEDYIKFNAQFLLREISAKPQAVELYALLKEHLYIDVHRNEIEKQVNTCHELETAKDNKSRTTALLLLSLMGVAGVINDIWGWFNEFDYEYLKSLNPFNGFALTVVIDILNELQPLPIFILMVAFLTLLIYRRTIKHLYKKVKKKAKNVISRCKNDNS